MCDISVQLVLGLSHCLCGCHKYVPMVFCINIIQNCYDNVQYATGMILSNAARLQQCTDILELAPFSENSSVHV